VEAQWEAPISNSKIIKYILIIYFFGVVDIYTLLYKIELKDKLNIPIFQDGVGQSSFTYLWWTSLF